MNTIIKNIQKQVEKKKFRKKSKNKALKLLDELSTKAENCGGTLLHLSKTCHEPAQTILHLAVEKICIEQNLGPAEEAQECNTQNCGKKC